MASPALLVTGASGLVGQALAARRPIEGLPRRHGAGLWWDPLGGTVHDDGRTLGAVVHLAGAGVADARWTDAHKAAVRDSRVKGTRTLVDWLAGRTQRPDVLLCASAVGYYGDRGDAELAEDAAPGRGFLAEVCQAWEAEAARAADAGIRVVVLRLGIVLSPDGGALRKMLTPFKLGGGGPLGSGKQWFPWVHVDDVVGAIEWALGGPMGHGVYNVVAPTVVRQGEFAQALGRALHRPAVLPAPAFALRAAFGREMANETLLVSQRVVPRNLLRDGYTFRYPALEPALGDLVG